MNELTPDQQQQLLALFASHQWLLLAWGVLALLCGGLVRLMKGDGPLPTWMHIAPSWRPAAAIAFGLLGSVFGALAAHVPWMVAVLGGVTAGFAAISGHEIVVEGMRNGRELFTPKGGSGDGDDGEDVHIPPAPPTPPNVMRSRMGFLLGCAVLLCGCTKEQAKSETDAILDVAPIVCAGIVALADNATLDNICHITNEVDPKVKEIAHDIMGARRNADAAARAGGCKPGLQATPPHLPL